MPNQHIIVNEGDGADLLPDVVTRETLPANDATPRLLTAIPWAGTGPLRGLAEESGAVVEYIPPERRRAA